MQAAHEGLPLIGDRTYHPLYHAAKRERAVVPIEFTRQALHAESLSLEHPDRPGTRMTLTAALPKDMQQLEAALRAGRHQNVVAAPKAFPNFPYGIEALMIRRFGSRDPTVGWRLCQSRRASSPFRPEPCKDKRARCPFYSFVLLCAGYRGGDRCRTSSRDFG